jgi:hypothetical protein
MVDLDFPFLIIKLHLFAIIITLSNPLLLQNNQNLSNLQEALKKFYEQKKNMHKTPRMLNP